MNPTAQTYQPSSDILMFLGKKLAVSLPASIGTVYLLQRYVKVSNGAILGAIAGGLSVGLAQWLFSDEDKPAAKYTNLGSAIVLSGLIGWAVGGNNPLSLGASTALAGVVLESAMDQREQQ